MGSRAGSVASRRRPFGQLADQSRNLVGWVAAYAHEHLPLYAITLLYIGSGFAIQAITGLQLTGDVTLRALLGGAVGALFFTGLAAGSLITVFLLTRTLLILPFPSGQPLFRSTWSDYRRHLRPERLASIFTVFLLLTPFMDMFVGFKRAIPMIQPFAWDAALMRLDGLLHFGHQPWTLLQPILGVPAVTKAFDLLYYAWFPVKLILLLWVAWGPRSRLRDQLLLSSFAIWIVLGTGLATLLSSAGPVYYGAVTGLADPFAPLMRYLHAVDSTYPLTALDVQSLLWSGYSSGRTQLVEGISAMPSLHVALPALFAFWGWRVDRRIGLALAVYTALIFVGSVHLGWHYAVDGYVAVVTAAMVWWACGRVLAAYERLGHPKVRQPAGV